MMEQEGEADPPILPPRSSYFLHYGHTGATAADARAVTAGRCNNLDYCSIGQHRELVRIPVGDPFVCPECGRPLRPPGEGSDRPVLLPALRLLMLVAGIGAGAIGGYALGLARRPQITLLPAKDLAPARSAQMALAISISSSPSSPGAKPVGASSSFDRILAKLGAVPAAGSTDADARKAGTEPVTPITTAVHIHPYPSHAPPVDRIDPPPVLESEKHFGDVTLDCVFASGATRPVCRASNIRGADAFSNAATAWLQDLAPDYPPGPDHRWRVTIQDFTGQARPRR